MIWMEGTVTARTAPVGDPSQHYKYHNKASTEQDPSPHPGPHLKHPGPHSRIRTSGSCCLLNQLPSPAPTFRLPQMEVFIERLARQGGEEWSEEDLDQLRLLSHDPKQAKALWQHRDAFGHLCQLPRLGARKTVANCLFHLPAARQAMASGVGGLLSGLLAALPVTVQVRGEDDYVALRLLFLVTVEVEGARLLLAHGYDDLLRVSLGEPGGGDGERGQGGAAAEDGHCLKREGAIESLRILYNVTRVAEGQSAPLGALICRGLSSENGEIVGNTFNLLLNCAGSLLLLHGERDLADLLTRALERVTGPAAGKEYVSAACLSLAQVADRDDTLRSALRHHILPSSFDRARPMAEGDALKARLARLLGSPAEQAAMAVGDLLWALLRRRLPRLLYHMGYGLMAGYLYARGLTAALPAALQEVAGEDDKGTRDGRRGDGRLDRGTSREVGRAKGRPDPPESAEAVLSSDEEALAEAGGLTALADWVTGGPVRGTFDSSVDADATAMTEGEREREADRLIDLFGRLERNGIIRVIRPGQDGGGEERDSRE